MFHNFGPLYSFTLRSKLRSKAFLISTLLTILFIFGFTNIDRILSNFADTDSGEALLVTENVELVTVMQSLGYESVEAANVTEDEARAGLDNGDYERSSPSSMAIRPASCRNVRRLSSRRSFRRRSVKCGMPS